LKKLLEPFGIKKYCTDGWGATREISQNLHEVGKRKTQRIERKLEIEDTELKGCSGGPSAFPKRRRCTTW